MPQGSTRYDMKTKTKFIQFICDECKTVVEKEVGTLPEGWQVDLKKLSNFPYYYRCLDCHTYGPPPEGYTHAMMAYLRTDPFDAALTRCLILEDAWQFDIDPDEDDGEPSPEHINSVSTKGVLIIHQLPGAPGKKTAVKQAIAELHDAIYYKRGKTYWVDGVYNDTAQGHPRHLEFRVGSWHEKYYRQAAERLNNLGCYAEILEGVIT